jgi:hypothetical protein
VDVSFSEKVARWRLFDDPEVFQTRERWSRMTCLSCFAQLTRRSRASAVTVKSEGARPLAMASMRRGEAKASAARFRMSRSNLVPRRAVSSNDSARPSSRSFIQARAFAIGVSSDDPLPGGCWPIPYARGVRCLKSPPTPSCRGGSPLGPQVAEARGLNPAITIKRMKDHTPNGPAVFDGLRKVGLPEE